MAGPRDYIGLKFSIVQGVSLRIGILEDDPVQMELLCHVGRAMGHSTSAFTRGNALLRTLAYESFDLLVLDWELPDISGIEVLHWIRSNLSERLPVLFITSRLQECDIVLALNGGADDYAVKPVGVREIAARIQALLRRGYPEFAGVQDFGAYTFNPDDKSISLHGNAIAVTAREFDIAYFLFRNEGRLISRAHLHEAVWRSKLNPLSRSLDTHISRLRIKLALGAENGFKIASLYNHGYRLEALPPLARETIPDSKKALASFVQHDDPQAETPNGAAR